MGITCEVLVISSSVRLLGVLGGCFRVGQCSMVVTRSNASTLRGVRGGPSVVLLSVGVPGVSKLRMYEHVQNGMAYPVVFLATGIRRRSEMGKLLSNKSSCVLGPFDLGRLSTHVVTRLGHRRHRGKGSRCEFRKSLDVSCKTGEIRVNRGSLRLAGLRCTVVRFLSVGPKRIFSERQVCRGIYNCSTRNSDHIIARLVQEIEGGLTRCARARCVRAM